MRARGYFFTATAAEVRSLNLIEGPALSDRAIPHRYAPLFLDLVVSVVDPKESGLELVGRQESVSLHRVPSKVCATLAECTTARPDFTRRRIAELTDQLMHKEVVKGHFQRGGIRSVLMILRGHALKAHADQRDVYYWYARPDGRDVASCPDADS